MSRRVDRWPAQALRLADDPAQRGPWWHAAGLSLLVALGLALGALMGRGA